MKILNILSSLNGENSNSKKLVNAINAKLISAYGQSSIVVRDLNQNPIPHLHTSHFHAFGTATHLLTEEDKMVLEYSDSAIADIQQSDIIVIAVPFYNFSIPGTLKAWIDQIVRAGVTFTYGETGPKGMLTGKKVYLAIASGGIYTTGAMKNRDFAEPYLRVVLGFIGLTDITTFRMEGTKIPGILEHAFEMAHTQVLEHTL